MLKSLLGTIQFVNVQLHRYTGYSCTDIPGTVAQIYRVTPEYSARKSCDNTGLVSLSPRLVHLPDRRYIRDCFSYWNPLVTLMTRGFAEVRACCFDNWPLIHLIPFCVAFDLAARAFSRLFSCEAVVRCWTGMLRSNTAYWNERYKMRMFGNTLQSLMSLVVSVGAKDDVYL